jgi:hypothetical protein
MGVGKTSFHWLDASFRNLFHAVLYFSGGVGLFGGGGCDHGDHVANLY